MTSWILWFVASIAAIEIVRKLSLVRAFGVLLADGRRAMRVTLRRGCSDWAKERAMRLASLRLLVRSLWTAGGIAVVAIPILAAWWMTALPQGWLPHLALLVATIGWSIMRRMAVNGSGERLFQRLTLGMPSTRAISFDIERAAHMDVLAAPTPCAPVFVTGLARAGTTILMRALYDSGAFASLTYRDLPLPLAPNLWARATRRTVRSVEAYERGHGDGIVHDLDSPEAIEEVFWLQMQGDAYRLDDRLSPMSADAETVERFRDYVRLVQHRYGADRYLSKNNTNILRLDTLIAAFPDAILLHPFRDPVEQAASLMHQHRSACAAAALDPYRRRFMTWLGHHEFGADHRPFAFHGARPEGDPATLDYWLARWSDTYAYLLDQPEPVVRQQRFIDYDRIAEDRARLELALGGWAALAAPVSLAVICPRPHGFNMRPLTLAAARAYRIHTRLRERYAQAIELPHESTVSSHHR